MDHDTVATKQFHKGTQAGEGLKLENLQVALLRGGGGVSLHIVLASASFHLSFYPPLTAHQAAVHQVSHTMVLVAPFYNFSNGNANI